ncbi:uncharacterized protein UDID_03289 [Ustilago sp. UG-2017a]|nr:uncharacterized protein UDID_03289 [Ustilago sp. UG-2017a]
MTIPPRSPLRLLQAQKGANTTISVSPHSPFLTSRLLHLSPTPSSSCGLPSPDLLSPPVYSPLSMLFEGIIADSASIYTLQGGEGSGILYSPLDSPRDYACSRCSSSINSSEASTIVPTPQTLAMALEKKGGRVGEELDQALEELLQQDSDSRSSSRLGLRPERREGGVSVPCGFAAKKESSGCAMMNDDTPSILTMPGGGPLLDTINAECLKPFWNSPLLEPTALGLYKPSAPSDVMKEQVQHRGKVPSRPPRPAHCSTTLEDLTDLSPNSSSGTFKPASIAGTASPSLRSLRKTPAEYLKSHRRTSSIETLDTFGVPRGLGQAGVAKADPAPVMLEAEAAKVSDSVSISSMATFVSARSMDSLQQRSVEQDREMMVEKVSQYSSVPIVRIAPAPVRQKKEQQQLQHQRRPGLENRCYPPSASRSPAPPAPQELHLPQSKHGEKPQATQRKPSLLRKLSLNILSSRKIELQNHTGPTDYSKSPRFSSSLPVSVNTTVTPFPITVVPFSTTPPVRTPLSRKTSFFRPAPSNPNMNGGSPASPAVVSSQFSRKTSFSCEPPKGALARERSTSFSTRPSPPLSTSLSPPMMRFRSASDLNSQYISRNRSGSMNSSYPPPSASSLSNNSPLPRKSSLKRTRSRSSRSSSSTTNSATACPGSARPQPKSNRARIVGSATECVSAKKVTFGDVTTSRVARVSQLEAEESVEILVDEDARIQERLVESKQDEDTRQREIEKEAKKGREEKGIDVSPAVRGPWIQLHSLSMPWGRRS